MSIKEPPDSRLVWLDSASGGEGFELNSLTLIHNSIKQSDSKTRDRLIYVHADFWLHYKCTVGSPLTRTEGTNMTNALEGGDEYAC